MKVLIVYSPATGHEDADRARFSKILSTLDNDGIIGKLLPVKEKQQLLIALQDEQPDIVFSASYYVEDEFNEKRNIHTVLETLQIPYIGSAPEVLELVLSKSDLKKKWQTDHVNTPGYFLVNKGDSLKIFIDNQIAHTNYPFILKPDREGNSRGLNESSIVFDQMELASKLTALFESYDTVMVERYLGLLPGMKEFTVAMIGNGDQKLLMPARIVLKNKKKIRIVTTQDKETHNTKAIPVEDDEIKERIIALAEKAFTSAGVRDYSRCDIILAEGNLFAIEINGQPMIPDKWFESCAEFAGFTGTQYINAIILAGIVRNIYMGVQNLQIPFGLKKSIPIPVFEKIARG